MAQEITGSISRTVKVNTVSPTARHRFHQLYPSTYWCEYNEDLIFFRHSTCAYTKFSTQTYCLQIAPSPVVRVIHRNASNVIDQWVSKHYRFIFAGKISDAKTGVTRLVRRKEEFSGNKKNKSKSFGIQ